MRFSVSPEKYVGCLLHCTWDRQQITRFIWILARRNFAMVIKVKYRGPFQTLIPIKMHEVSRCAEIMAGIIFIIIWSAKTPWSLRCPETRSGDSDHRSRSQQSHTGSGHSHHQPPAPSGHWVTIVTWRRPSVIWTERRWRVRCDPWPAGEDDGQVEAGAGRPRHPRALAAGGDARPGPRGAVSVPGGVAGGVAPPRPWRAAQRHGGQHRHQGGVRHIIRVSFLDGEGRS